jgi:hypothetical protein
MGTPDIYVPIRAVLAWVEPDVAIYKDEALARPVDYRPNSLYLYPADEDHAIIESGPTIKQNFRLVLDLVVDDQGEQAAGVRIPAVTLALEARAGAYGDRIRSHQRAAEYDHLRVAAIDWQALNGIGYRGFRMRLDGYRLVD